MKKFKTFLENLSYETSFLKSHLENPYEDVNLLALADWFVCVKSRLTVMNVSKAKKKVYVFTQMRSSLTKFVMPYLVAVK